MYNFFLDTYLKLCIEFEAMMLYKLCGIQLKVVEVIWKYVCFLHEFISWVKPKKYLCTLIDLFVVVYLNA